MNQEHIERLLRYFDFQGEYSVERIQTGNINTTLVIQYETDGYVLQKINRHVFHDPIGLMRNLDLVVAQLEQSDYPRQILKPVISIEKKSHQQIDNEYWRVFPYFDNCVTVNEVHDATLAYEVAYAFAEFVAYLTALEPTRLIETIPDFHNTPMRFQQFDSAVKNADQSKLRQSEDQIKFARDQQSILSYYKNCSYVRRVVHYDTKVNNLLLNKHSMKAECVIDLDTVMPGFLAFDFGDLVRTICPPVNENSTDFDSVRVRPDMLVALRRGYDDGMKDNMSALERDTLLKGAALLIFEQGIRFLTDFLSENQYYHVSYPEQNLIRAKNQFYLLQDFLQFVES